MLPLRGGVHISNILQTEIEKKNDYRMISNLKDLNKFVVYKHFIMESLNQFRNLLHQVVLWHQ